MCIINLYIITYKSMKENILKILSLPLFILTILIGCLFVICFYLFVLIRSFDFWYAYEKTNSLLEWEYGF